MRYDKIDNSLFIENRKRFTAKMQPNSIAILTSNDVKHNNADDVMGFAQNNDLFYLSGIDQEETILVLYPDAFKKENRAILFVKETSELIKIWDGEKLTQEKATEISGISRVTWNKDFESVLQAMAFEADAFYLGHNEHYKRATNNQETQQDRMIKWCKEKYPLHQYYRAAKITRNLRPVKSDKEIELLQKAADISVESFSRILKACKPGKNEYELEAELTYNLVKSGASHHAFQPIVASGKNACALHYNTNDSVCKDGEMILLDFGVCYANYNSDTTRCFPVNGKFSERQAAVYRSVLYCLKEGSKLLKAGVLPADYEKNMAGLVEAELIKLNLLNADAVANQDPEKPLYKQYFMHGTAHYLGLDVHDVGLYSRPFEAGMILTCEPGIYIAEEGIGCRLEDDYLITEDGNVNLTAKMPIEIEEIEALMKLS
ncbi:aminopeptidase P N-terminal domain-containing protein [Tenacibaculum finnmarkense genomovar ulcerans]|uniref:aminopeptidase P N-terminal domain-containing protein n=1 Tax=Tenacibaculum finnmarkense TaxID=2781243 RepID=UPI001E507FC7|nr:aminopeptidase P N-terminal domain-containing protein [Tenacibaculum finnmarkense]MCD8432843.1 aminopeptidase P N-terminal domain-containing protein [Tenacibaculum finnmarkense genomovar ulcerans]MCG8236602.1 aminopeptidase P N-terminal domain-containing protein [Tenacibaculum finnmarkense genomovar ulcerans]MCG8808083.1 M24 family metallopeptidase [Tenacibaculum finnmarkense]MCG8818299.1 M24 family metallopeptidase [Tenacibaculum finnmarkense]MCG8830793.1 M24 family metallopeptidase [Tenac